MVQLKNLHVKCPYLLKEWFKPLSTLKIGTIYYIPCQNLQRNSNHARLQMFKYNLLHDVSYSYVKVAPSPPPHVVNLKSIKITIMFNAY